MAKKSVNAAPPPAVVKKPRKINWDETTFAVIIGMSPVVKQTFTTAVEALQFVQALSVRDQGRAYVGHVVRVNVETKITLK